MGIVVRVASCLAFGFSAVFCTVRADDSQPVRIRVNRESRAVSDVEFYAGKDLVTRYHVGPMVAKPYCWPLYGAGGVSLTRAWPMKEGEPNETKDHIHQKSAWFCHGDVIPEGITLAHKVKGVEGVDFWAESPGHGRIVCTAVSDPEIKSQSGAVKTKNEWRTADGIVILDETRKITLHNFGDTRLFVFDIDLHACNVPIHFGDTKEGAFGIRINDTLAEAKGKGRIVNAEGKTTEKQCWGRVSSWCDYSGPIDGKTVGLTIFSDPDNPSPACWHSRGYGLMAANPFGRNKSGFPEMKGRSDLVKINKGDHLKLRFGLLLHPGNAQEGKVADYFEKFVKLKGT